MSINKLNEQHFQSIEIETTAIDLIYPIDLIMYCEFFSFHLHKVKFIFNFFRAHMTPIKEITIKYNMNLPDYNSHAMDHWMKLGIYSNSHQRFSEFRIISRF